MEGRNARIKYFGNQKYQKLKRQCIRKKVLFEDPMFVPSNKLFNTAAVMGQVEWKRPTELCLDPRLVVQKLASSNIEQGIVGNCWVVAASCALAKEKDLWNKVVPHCEAQDYKGKSVYQHGGLFVFRFWQFGRWTEVVIDDRLPTVNGKLIFVHSPVKNEFWGSLLEKAYAKLFGSYASLEGGNLVDALVDFTAGFAERLTVEAEGAKSDETKRSELFNHLKDERKNHSLMCCAIGASGANRDVFNKTSTGLIKGHAYCITDARTVNIKRTGFFAFFKGRETLNMIRLRNPWGEKEWNGAFSDCSLEWSKVTKSDKEKCGLTYQDDGEFWMSFDDFCKHFTDISICYLVNTSWFSFSQTWCESEYFGRWSIGPKGSSTDRAGGCSNNRLSFLQNPQYFFDVKINEEKIMIMLQQSGTRGQKTLLSIGFQILKVELNRRYRLHRLLDAPVISSDFISTRNILQKCILKQGKYFLIPTTFQPKKIGNYLLRVFSKNQINFREISLDAPKPPICSFLARIKIATWIRVLEGKDIKTAGENSSKTPSTYFILQCETEKLRSSTQTRTNNPKWKEGAVFFRKHLDSRIKIQVWSQKPVKDVLVGETIIDATQRDKTVAKQILLNSKNGEGQPVVVGKIYVEMLTTKRFSTV